MKIFFVIYDNNRNFANDNHSTHIMSASDFRTLQYRIEATQRLWAPIFEEEEKAIKNQPTLSEKEWMEMRASHAVV